MTVSARKRIIIAAAVFLIAVVCVCVGVHIAFADEIALCHALSSAGAGADELKALLGEYAVLGEKKEISLSSDDDLSLLYGAALAYAALPEGSLTDAYDALNDPSFVRGGTIFDLFAYASLRDEIPELGGGSAFDGDVREILKGLYPLCAEIAKRGEEAFFKFFSDIFEITEKIKSENFAALSVKDVYSVAEYAAALLKDVDLSRFDLGSGFEWRDFLLENGEGLNECVKAVSFLTRERFNKAVSYTEPPLIAIALARCALSSGADLDAACAAAEEIMKKAGFQVPAGEVKALVDDLAAFDPDLAGEEEIAKVREMLDAFARQISAQPLILSLRF